jgi:branched-chain amino acid transport system permease protein
MTVELFIQQLINAISLGSLYALLALGLAIVYGVLKVLNFAHGDLVAVTGYIMWFFWMKFEMPFAFAVFAGILGATGISILTELIAFRPLRKASYAVMLISSLAVSIIIQNLIRMFIDPRPRGLRIPAVFDKVITIGSFNIGALSIITLLISLTAMGILLYFLLRTRWGLALRAAAVDFEVTRLVGVPANRTISMAFAIAGLLAGIGGALWVIRTGGIAPAMGLNPIIKAFVSNVIGGLGSLPGAVVGGLIFGFFDIFFKAFLPGPARPFVDAFALTAVVIILFFKPRGVMFKKEEKLK